MSNVKRQLVPPILVLSSSKRQTQVLIETLTAGAVSGVGQESASAMKRYNGAGRLKKLTILRLY
ncbi:MAG: hypothetical protein WKF84_21945 [Pyrinomonadaceae bacterium]